MNSPLQPALQGNTGARLAGKVALVTGIAAGIGKGCAMLFAQQGAKVFGCDIDAAGAAATVKEAVEQGLTLESLHPCDLTAPAQVKSFIDQAVERHGGFDILVNAAAFGVFAPLESMDYETGWRKTLTGELDIVFLACQAAWPHLVKRGGGAILNFASANAYVALETSPALAHCAGKGGVLAMTRQIAAEGARHGIRANTISPGLVETAATRYPLDNVPGFREQVMAKLMVKRLGQPSDIAWAAVYLCSDEASWVTAADFQIDGGATSW
ncbi:MAG TPA: SDR family NAD(P)-dependent oxidoreductase [Burkholderiaceae bacterium]|nr:SDR family NAD(P)-dependent oxidoreductase [Burkholderiaceae bacterium]